MFKRLIEDEILNLLEGYNKPVLVLGARQVGKTTLVKKIAKSHGSFLYLNLEMDTIFKQVVDESELNFEVIMNKYCLIKNITYKEDTLIVFDEIQFSPKLMTALKYFYEADVKNRIIATGSNLGLSINKREDWSFPVGKIHMVNMYPMTFEEYLYASSNSQFVKVIKDSIRTNHIDDIFHDTILELFDMYISLGGMPEVLDSYFKTANIVKAREIQNDILKGYEMDILKYTEPKISTKILEIYKHIDVMLNSDNQKFKITKVDQGAYRNIEFPLSWLLASKLALRCNRIEAINLPLRCNVKENSFKLYFSDVGLLLRKANYTLTDEIKNNDKIYYGLIIENYFANILTLKNQDLFYYHRRTTEIDFVIQNNQSVIPIEVKSGNNTKAKSLKTYIEMNNPKDAYKFSRNNYSKNGIIYNIPLYCFEFMEFF